MTARSSRTAADSGPDPHSGPHPGPIAGVGAGTVAGSKWVSSSELAAGFDEFYRDARDRLLLQTFALTGDLAVARSAVREAFVVSWHHWRKTARLDDPETSVRPLAWRKALRRSSTRPWGRRKDLDPPTRATLDALATLPLVQRKALLLTQLAAVSLEEMAHEVGLTLEVAERELQLGAAHLAIYLKIPTSAIPQALNALATATRDVAWPRVTIIRRAGSARRRAHTVLGGTAAVIALVAAGTVAVDATGARPTLDREGVPAVSAPPPTSGPAVNALPDTALLPVAGVQEALPGRIWRDGGTSDNSAGNGRVLPCQLDRYADPRGTAAWVRIFRSGDRAGTARTVVQYAEASGAARAAERTYARTLRWFTSCPAPRDEPSAVARLQLVSTADTPGVGDQASLVVLRSRRNGTTYTVGVARTGLFTTTTSFTATRRGAAPDRARVARLLATAVDRLCVLADGGRCAADRPRVADRAPYPVGKAPWMLSEIDLPPLSRDQGPWVGTAPARLAEDRIDSGAIGCDTVHLFGRFRNQAIQRNQFRTFVLSAADLPPEVGLTQTVGSLPAGAARAFVTRFRSQVAACPDQDGSAGTEVDELASTTTARSALSAWHLVTALPGDRTVEYDVAVVRSGTSVSLLVYVAAPRARIADDDFVALARRSLERLEQMRAHGG